MRRAHRSSPEFQYRKSLALLLIFRSSHKLCAPASSQQRSGGHFYDHRALAHSLAYYTCSSSAAAHKNHTHTHTIRHAQTIYARSQSIRLFTHIYIERSRLCGCVSRPILICNEGDAFAACGQKHYKHCQHRRWASRSAAICAITRTHTLASYSLV